MSQAESPAMTDPEEIKDLLRQVLATQDGIMHRLDIYRDAINATGENVAWLVTNTQGLFQMFSSPQFMGQMSALLTKQGLGQNGESADRPGPDNGPDGGREGDEILADAG